MLKIALPNKGRLADDTRELFGDAGLPVLSRGDRALSASLGGEFEALFVRAQDIPEFVADGVADVGVTGWDLVCEAARPVERRLDLGFGECRLIAAAREDSVITNLEEIAPGTRIATSFPKITRDFFERAARMSRSCRYRARRKSPAPGDRRGDCGHHVDRLDAQGQRAARDRTTSYVTRAARHEMRHRVRAGQG